MEGQVKITITIGDDYTAELRERLESYGISVNALAREMGIDRSQLARWFNSPMLPRLDNVLRMERAVLSLRAKQKRRREKG